MIHENPRPFITSKEFSSVDKHILLSLLERDDLQDEEIVIWDCLIKWGIEQTPELEDHNNDLMKWDQKDFEALKKTLNPFIPLIRFVEISPNDFFDKIGPYEAAIPHHIYQDLVEFYHKGTIPKTIPLEHRLASTIIKPKHVNIISNWIDRNHSNVHLFNNKFKFNRIYKGSQDGFDSTTFNNKCDGQGPFIVLIGVQSEHIYGGYNLIGYSSRKGEWLTTSDSFIFSFNMKIGRMINANRSMYESGWSFFNFGEHLYITGKNLSLGNYENYERIFSAEKVYLPIVDFEVFSIIEK